MFWRIVVLLSLLCTPMILSQAAGDDPFVLYGNEEAFVNNIVLTVDDCSMEYNVRSIFDTLRNRGLTATFFCNTANMREQDPQLWRDIVAAGNEIAYHTRFHM